MKSNMGLLMNIVLGIVGAAIASAILSFFGIILGGWIGYLIAGMGQFSRSQTPDTLSEFSRTDCRHQFIGVCGELYSVHVMISPDLAIGRAASLVYRGQVGVA